MGVLMHASETKFQPIIEGTKQYVVPLFQRSYSWQKKEWEMLWNDLYDLYCSDNPRTHFIGSIVTMPTVSVPEGVAKYLLIDGQQRLTTIFILLALLRDRAKQDDEVELANEINDTLLVNPYKKDDDYFKLQPTQADREAFRRLIFANSFDNENLFTEAYKYFERKIKQNEINIEKFKQRITNNLSVVSIVLSADDNPHLVFESLNAKGRPLTQSDLIRNYFFMRIHVHQQDKIYHEYWKPMQDTLGDDLTEFIRHFLVRGGTPVKQSEVYYALKEQVKIENALEYLKNLYRFSKYYSRLLNPKNEENKALSRALSRLNTLEVTTVYPFLLNCYDDYSNNLISYIEFLEIIRLIENFIIRRFVCGIPTNQLNKIFPPLYQQAKNKDGVLLDNIKLILQAKDYPKDPLFKARLMDTKLYGSGDRAVKTKLILESIMESFNHKEQVSVETLSIEHIMPQTLTEQWQDYLGDDWEVTHDLFLHTLGNLTLTGYNSELSNYDFDTKRNYFLDSNIELNKYFHNINTWKRNDIENRAEYLSNIVLNIWPYFGDTNDFQPDSTTNITGTTPKELYILGERFVVQSWRDVFQQTMNLIAELEPEKFETIIQKFPRVVGRDKKRFRAIRELKNGAFIEVNLSAMDTRKYCYQALAEVELTEDDWKVIVS